MASKAVKRDHTIEAICTWLCRYFGSLISNMTSDLTSEAVWRPYWPQNLILFVGLKLMEVLNLLTTNQFLQNSSKSLQKSSRMSPKILRNKILNFPPCQPQVY